VRSKRILEDTSVRGKRGVSLNGTKSGTIEIEEIWYSKKKNISSWLKEEDI